VRLVELNYCAGMIIHRSKQAGYCAVRGAHTCRDYFGWVLLRTSNEPPAGREPAPNDPDVFPIREPEPEPDTPEPEPSDDPERIDPIRTGVNVALTAFEF
jgi:hypothetical protein